MRRDRVRWLASAAFVAIAMAVPLTRDRVAAIVGLRNSYTCGSIVLLLSAVALTRLWPAADSDLDLRAYRWPTAWIGWAALAFGLCFWMASALLPGLFGGPLDFYKADMLPVIEAGVREFLAGRTPYTRYRPHSMAAHAAVLGPRCGFRSRCRFSPTAIFGCSRWQATSSSSARAALPSRTSVAARQWTLLLAVAGPTLLLAAHPDIHVFYPIAHTPGTGLCCSAFACFYGRNAGRVRPRPSACSFRREHPWSPSYRSF